MLTVCEIFKSIQGESSFAGRCCTFVRLGGCNLECRWCDTAYAKREPGEKLSVESVLEIVSQHKLSLVEITGGEPLLQKDTPLLCRRFLDSGYTVLVETNGSFDIGVLPEGVHRIVDVKCPGSDMNEHFFTPNIEKLTSADECKFVISDIRDAEWALDFVETNEIDKKCTVYFSPAQDTFDLQSLAEFVLTNNPTIRLGVQLHKFIWGNRRGV